MADMETPLSEWDREEAEKATVWMSNEFPVMAGVIRRLLNEIDRLTRLGDERRRGDTERRE